MRQENYGIMLAFTVNEFFSFGSPLSLILAYRLMLTDNGNRFDSLLTTDELVLPICFSCSAIVWTIVQSLSCL